MGFRARPAWAGTMTLTVTSFVVLGSFLYLGVIVFSFVKYNHAILQGVVNGVRMYLKHTATP